METARFMDFATPLILFILLLAVGFAVVGATPISRRSSGRSATIWAMAFAIGAFGTTMGINAAQLLL